MVLHSPSQMCQKGVYGSRDWHGSHGHCNPSNGPGISRCLINICWMSESMLLVFNLFLQCIFHMVSTIIWRDRSGLVTPTYLSLVAFYRPSRALQSSLTAFSASCPFTFHMCPAQWDYTTSISHQAFVSQTLPPPSRKYCFLSLHLRAYPLRTTFPYHLSRPPHKFHDTLTII